MTTSATSGALRVGIVGVGAMGTSHGQTLTRWIPGSTVSMVYDYDAGRAASVARELLTEQAGSAEELIASDQVDAVIIASPDETHERLVLSCLAADKPVLCEKPLAADAAGSQRIVDAELARGRRLIQVGFMRRYDPAYVQLRELVAAGGLGDPRVVHAIHRNAQAHPAATSEGVVVNSMIHELDTVPWLLSDPLVAITIRSPKRPEGALLDLQVALLETAGGVLATVEVFVNAGYGYDIQCEVVGATGTARLTPPYGLAIRETGHDGVQVSADFLGRFADAYRIELGAWVDASRQGVATGASAWDGHRANLAAAAGVESLRSGARVSLQPAPAPALYG